ncbi:MAG: hypothetical protein PHX21_12725 [bacterium]|nr:hypothetical protein [bacterium]
MEQKHKPKEVIGMLEQKEVWIAQTLFVKPDMQTTAFYTQLGLKPVAQPERIRRRDTWESFYQMEIDRLKAKGVKAEFQYNSKKEVRVIRRLTKEEIKEALEFLNKVPELSQKDENYVLRYLPVRIKMVEEDGNRIEKKKGKKEEMC